MTQPERNDTLLRKVGDVIAAEPERYDQDVVLSYCGTVACVAGHAALLAHPEKTAAQIINSGPVLATARDALGLSGDEWPRLFDFDWQPAGDPSTPLHERVQAALYALAEGASVEEVSA